MSVAKSTQHLSVMIDVPAGYKLTGEFRNPKRGENFYLNGIAAKATTHSGAYPILEKVWEAESWMPRDRWLYKYSWTGAWYFTDREPKGSERGGYLPGYSAVSVDASQLAAMYNKVFTPPVHAQMVRIPK